MLLALKSGRRLLQRESNHFRSLCLLLSLTLHFVYILVDTYLVYILHIFVRTYLYLFTLVLVHSDLID